MISRFLKKVQKFGFAQRFFVSRNFAVVEADDATYKKEVYESDLPVVVVDLYAEWCGPCKKLKPLITKVVEENYDDKVKLVCVEISKNHEAAEEFKVSAVPHVVALKDGEIVDSFLGMKAEGQLKSFFDKLLEADI